MQNKWSGQGVGNLDEIAIKKYEMKENGGQYNDSKDVMDRRKTR